MHATVTYTEDPEAIVQVLGNEHAIYLDYALFGINEAKELQRQAYVRSETGIKDFLVSFQSTTREAQNALLKLIEEPPPGVSFAFLIPPGTSLLPTVLSRVQVRRDNATRSDNIDWERFLAAQTKERLEQVVAWQKKKDSEWVHNLQQGLMVWICGTKRPNKSLQMILERLGSRGASNKMLLELLALELPEK